MNRAAFDRAVTEVLDATTASQVAVTLTFDIANAYRRAGRPPPLDLDRNVRAALHAALEPTVDADAARYIIGDIILELSGPPPPLDIMPLDLEGAVDHLDSTPAGRLLDHSEPPADA